MPRGGPAEPPDRTPDGSITPPTPSRANRAPALCPANAGATPRTGPGAPHPHPAGKHPLGLGRPAAWRTEWNLGEAGPARRRSGPGVRCRPPPYVNVGGRRPAGHRDPRAERRCGLSAPSAAARGSRWSGTGSWSGAAAPPRAARAMELEELGIREECGVFGCIASGAWPTELDVPHVITLGLVGLQHRGQESAGIVTSDGESSQAFKVHKGMGLINHVFSADSLKKLYPSNLGIGHTRYSTSGISELQNCQPFVVETLHGKIAVAHNGELTNAAQLRRKLMRHGVGLSTGSDSELITQLLAFTPPLENDDTADWVARIKNLMKETPTSYSLLIMHKDIIYAVRDPYGNRPLCIGRLIPVGDMNGKGKDNTETEGWVVSSESCSFLSIGAEYYREVLPGEIVKISRHDVQTLDVVRRSEGDPSAFCIFEYVYFARPDSIFEGQMVYSVRKRCGQQLAIEAPVEADLVSTVPESATPAALGYAQKCGLPYVEVLCKNRYVGRTFIQPNMRLRQLGVAKKFGVLSDNFKGKRVVIIDDSIVRGNTISPIIKLLRESGAKEVHIRVASPPIRFPCYMGINIPTKEELIANRPEFRDLANYIGADSVVYLSVEGLVSSVQESIKARQDNNPKTDKSFTGKLGHCTACLTGDYPVELEW